MCRAWVSCAIRGRGGKRWSWSTWPHRARALVRGSSGRRPSTCSLREPKRRLFPAQGPTPSQQLQPLRRFPPLSYAYSPVQLHPLGSRARTPASPSPSSSLPVPARCRRLRAQSLQRPHHTSARARRTGKTRTLAGSSPTPPDLHRAAATQAYTRPYVWTSSLCIVRPLHTPSDTAACMKHRRSRAEGTHVSPPAPAARKISNRMLAFRHPWKDRAKARARCASPPSWAQQGADTDTRDALRVGTPRGRTPRARTHWSRSRRARSGTGRAGRPARDFGFDRH